MEEPTSSRHGVQQIHNFTSKASHLPLPTPIHLLQAQATTRGSCREMASSESTEITSRGAPQEPKNRFLSLIPKFPFGFSNRGGGEGGRVDVVIKKKSSAGEAEGEGEVSRTSGKPDVVKFRFSQPQAEPLKLEAETAEQNSNPLLLWQVYALGGFIFMKWAWAKWQERQADAKKGDSKDDQSPADDE